MDLSIGAVTNPQNYYLYNKKELQPELGLYDYGARLYDPVVARWTTVDPMAEMYQHWSTYNYGTDNPISNIDRDGQASEGYATRFVDPTGKTVLNTDDGRDDVFMLTWNQVNAMQQQVAAMVNGGVEFAKTMTNSTNWNDAWRNQSTEVLSESTLKQAGYYGLHSAAAQAAQVKFLITGSLSDEREFLSAEVKGQWSDPVLVVGSLLAFAHAGVGVAEDLTTPKYAGRVRARGVEDPMSHNFPYSYDDAILSTKPKVTSSGYKIYTLEGSMNGKQGVFEIGVNKSGIIDHRFFRPSK